LIDVFRRLGALASKLRTLGSSSALRVCLKEEQVRQKQAAAEAKGDTQSKNQMAKKALEARLKEEQVRQKQAAAEAKKTTAIANNRLLEMRDKAAKGLLQVGDVRSQTDPTLLRSIRKGYSTSAYNNTLSPADRAEAIRMRNITDDAIRSLRAKRDLDEVGKHAALNREARNLELLNPKHANTSTDLGTRAIQQKTEQLNRTKALEQQNATRFRTTADLNNLGAVEIAQAKKILNYRVRTAEAGSAAEKQALALLEHLKAQVKAAADSATKLRLVLVQDTQTNATQMTAAQLFNDAGNAIDTLNSFQNPNNFGRFRVWKDKMVCISNLNLAGSPTTADVIQAGWKGTFKINITFKQPVVVHFNATNGGTVADIVDNSFHIIAGTDNAAYVPQLFYYARVCYKDV